MKNEYSAQPTDIFNTNYRKWSFDEQAKLLRCVVLAKQKNEKPNWKAISRLVQTRTARQCYRQYLAIDARLNAKNVMKKQDDGEHSLLFRECFE